MHRNLTLRAAALAALALPSWLAAEPVSLARLVEPGAVGAVFVEDVPEVVSWWEKSPYLRMWQDPEVARFFAPLREEMQVAEWDTLVQEATGHSIEELSGLVRGELMIAVGDLTPVIEREMRQDEGATEPGRVELPVLLAAYVGDNASEVERLLALAAEKDEDVTDETFDFNGVTVHHLKFTADEADDASADDEGGQSPDDTPEVRWALTEGHVLIAFSQATIERAITVIGGTELPSLADSENYQAGRRTSADAEVFAHFEFGWLHNLVTQAAGQIPSENPMGIRAEDVVAALGLEGLHGMSMGTDLGADRTVLTTAFRYDVGAPGLPGLLAFAPRPQTLPTFVPKSWLSVGVVGYDFGAAWDALFGMIDRASPMVAGIVDGKIRELNRNASIDLVQGFVRNLGPTVVAATVAPAGRAGDESLGAEGMQQFIAISVRDQDTLVRTIEGLKGLGGEMVAAMLQGRDYLGTTIYEFRPPAMGEGQAQLICYAINGGYFMYSVGSAAPIESAIQRQRDDSADGSFWDRAEVQAVLADVPADSISFQFEETGRILQSLCQTFADLQARTNAQREMAAQYAEEGEDGEDGESVQFIDPEAVPSIEVLSRYFRYTYGHGVSDADGVHSRAVIEHPAQ